MTRRLLGLVVLLAVATVAFLLSLKTGPIPMSWDMVWRFLTDSSFRISQDAQIIDQIRLPRAELAFLVGAALALSGTAFQALLRNPLADPYIVGTSAGAAVGAAAAVVLAHHGVTVDRPVVAFLGAVTTMVVVYRLALVGGRLPVETFLLAGVVVGSFLWALVSLLLIMSRERMQEVVYWLMGDLSTASYDQIHLALPYILLGTIVLYLLSHQLNLITLGEETAFHLGVSTEWLKIAIVTVGSLLTAAAVSVSGLIGFVGLIIPHLARSLTGSDHRFLLPAAALGGGAFLLLADTLSRSILPNQELPVGVVTALLGAPFFLLLLQRREAGLLMLDLAHVSHHYGPVPSLQDVSMWLSSGDFVCLLGPNGAGKSTLLRVASGLLRPTSGEVRWGDRVMSSVPRRDMARQIAFVPQRTPLDFPFTVREIVMMGRAPHQNLLGVAAAADARVVNDVLEVLELGALADRPVTALSGGEAQRAILASALAQQPQVLILDEPTSHLDPHFALLVLEALVRLNRERTMTVLLSLHDVNLAALFGRRLAVLAHGRIVFEGSPAEVLTVDRMAEAFGVPVQIYHPPGTDVPQVVLLPRTLPSRKT